MRGTRQETVLLVNAENSFGGGIGLRIGYAA